MLISFLDQPEEPRRVEENFFFPNMSIPEIIMVARRIICVTGLDVGSSSKIDKEKSM